MTYNPEYEEYQVQLKSKFDNVRYGLNVAQLQELLAKGTAALGNPKKKKVEEENVPF